MQITLRARLLRKRPRAQGLLFLDVLLEAEPWHAQFVLSAGTSLSVTEVSAYRAALRVGDAVSVTGCWGVPEAQLATAEIGRPPDAHGGFYVADLGVIEEHAVVHGESANFCGAAPDYGHTDCAHLSPPEVVLQCSGPHAARLAEYCREMYPGTICGVVAPQNRSPDRALLVRLPTEMTSAGFVQSIAGDVHVQGVLRRAFIIESRMFLSLKEALAHLSESVATQSLGCVSRVQVYPRYLEQCVVQEFERSSLPLHTKQFTHVASLVWVGAMYAVGLAPRAAFVAEESAGLDIFAAGQPKDSPVCRAYAKLHEAFARSGWAAEVAAMDSGPGLALDIGASPGGWSVCLSSVWRCQEVWAVDPGELAPGVESGSVRHLRMKWQEALEELRSSARSVSVLVCDANISCDQTLDMLGSVAAFLAPQAFVVLTFKNTCKLKEDFRALKEQQLQRLGALCTGIREVQLLANRNETTLMARFSG